MSRSKLMRFGWCLLLLAGVAGCAPSNELPGTKKPDPFVYKGRALDKLACTLDFKSVGYCGLIEPLQDKIEVGKPMRFSLVLWKKGSSAGFSDPAGLQISSWLWMHMAAKGHGAPPILKRRATDDAGKSLDGVYELGRVLFTMPCTDAEDWWEFHIGLKKEDGSLVDEAVQQFKF